MASSSPRTSVVKQLYAVSMNQCAYSGCVTPLVDPATRTVVAEICHICAQSPGGPRYDVNQTDQERHAFENLILMCRNHHTIIDDENNLDRFTVEWLVDLKRRHENEASMNSAPPPIWEQLIEAIMYNSAIYEEGSSHLDFRGAYIKVGGEGGALGGGGGSGGSLTIVGTTRIPSGSTINLDGSDGQWPGGGGGGAGVVNFEGRSITALDFDEGLRISGFVVGEYIRVAEGLLFSSGSFPAFYRMPSIPGKVQVGFAVAVDYGDVAPHSLIRLEVVADSVSGDANATGFVDVEIPDWDTLVHRLCVASSFVLDVARTGVVNLKLVSGTATLSEYPIELRGPR